MAVRNKTEFIPDSIYFLTFTILEWQSVFTEGKYTNLVYKWFDYVKDRYQNKIQGYVIMPNHIHVLMFVSELSPDISKLIQNAKRFMAYEIVKMLKEDNRKDLLEIFRNKAETKKNAKHKIFKDRFDSKIIENEKMFLEKLSYIHNNPCAEKWKLARLPEEYNHSSASNYILNKGVYEIDFVE
jgi:putative transposase